MASVECGNERLRALIESLEKGVTLGKYRVAAYKSSRGRFREEANIDVGLHREGGVVEHLVSVKVFCGRPPVYRPWVEVFNASIADEEAGILGFHKSKVESWILDLAGEKLEGGESFFIEYYTDPETLRDLEMGVPVPATRLGYELLKRGFTWFKVWYYPEGFSEGGQKIQAQKPASPERMREHLEGILRDLERLAELRAKLADKTTLERAMKAAQLARTLYERIREKPARP